MVDDAGVDGLGVEREVTAAGGARHVAQEVFLERGLDGVAFGVAHPVAGAVGVGLGNEGAGLGADADGEDEDVFLGGAARPFGDLGVGLAAVGEEHEAVVAGGAFVEGLNGELEGAADLAAAARDGEGIDGLDGLGDGGVVGGEGGLQVGVAGEDDEADAVAGEQGEQVLGGELGAGEAVGDEVVREHGARAVDGEDDVAPALALGLLFLPPTRAAGGEDEQAEGGELKQEGGPGAQGGDAGDELMPQPGRGEGVQGAPPAVVGPPFAEQQDGRDEQEEEPVGVGEGEGGGHGGKVGWVSGRFTGKIVLVLVLLLVLEKSEIRNPKDRGRGRERTGGVGGFRTTAGRAGCVQGMGEEGARFRISGFGFRISDFRAEENDSRRMLARPEKMTDAKRWNYRFARVATAVRSRFALWCARRC